MNRFLNNGSFSDFRNVFKELNSIGSISMIFRFLVDTVPLVLLSSLHFESMLFNGLQDMKKHEWKTHFREMNFKILLFVVLTAWSLAACGLRGTAGRDTGGLPVVGGQAVSEDEAGILHKESEKILAGETRKPVDDRVDVGTIPSNYGKALDLWDNRASVMTYTSNGLFVRCGEPDFAKYIDGTWKNPWTLGQEIDGRKVAFFHRERGNLYLPTPAVLREKIVSRKPGGKGSGIEPPKKEKNAVLVFKIHGLFPRGKMAVRVNGRHAGSGIDVVEGRQRIRVSFPARFLARDENIITVFFGRSQTIPGVPTPSWRNAGYQSLRRFKRLNSGAALEAVGIGDESFDLPQEAVNENGIFTRISWKGEERGAFRLGKSSSFAYHLLVPAGAMLFFRYRVSEEVEKEDKSAAGVRVALNADGRPDEIIYRADHGPDGWAVAQSKRTVRSENGTSAVLDKGYRPLMEDGAAASLLDLKGFEDEAVKLVITGEGRAVDFFDVKILGPVTPVTPLAKKEIKYVFFWLADTLRKDVVGAYGSKMVNTPNFDELARRGVLFESPTIQGNHSKPSMGTIFTGTYPPVHGFVHDEARVGGRLIYEQFKDAGWTTAMFSSNGYVSSRWGFGRGLDKEVNFIRSNLPSSTEYLWPRAARFLDKNKDGPLFMALLTIDPHVSYNPPNKFLRMYYPGRYTGPVPRRVTGFYLERLITGKVRLNRPDDLRRLKALYKGEVSYNDHWFGIMMEHLEEMGILDQSLIVMTSDHGEQFNERGSFGHAKNLHEEEIAVPLIMWWPGLEKPGIRVKGDVEILDIYSTILDIAGIEQNPEAQSASLLERIKGGRAEAMHAAFSYDAGSARSITMGRYKLITVHSKNFRLYDMKEDPGERKPVTRTKPVALRLMRNVFSLHNAYLDQWKKSEWGRASNLKPRFAADFYGE